MNKIFIRGDHLLLAIRNSFLSREYNSSVQFDSLSPVFAKGLDGDYYCHKGTTKTGTGVTGIINLYY